MRGKAGGGWGWRDAVVVVVVVAKGRAPLIRISRANPSYTEEQNWRVVSM